MASKEITIDLNVLNLKNKEKLDKLQELIDSLQSEINILKNQIITDINIADTNFNMLDENTTKKLSFDSPYFKNSDDSNKLLKPYPTNFKTDQPMINDINMGEQAIKFIADKYKELITDIPNKLDFDKNWKIIDYSDIKENKWYILYYNDPKKVINYFSNPCQVKKNGYEKFEFYPSFLTQIQNNAVINYPYFSYDDADIFNLEIMALKFNYPNLKWDYDRIKPDDTVTWHLYEWQKEYNPIPIYNNQDLQSLKIFSDKIQILENKLSSILNDRSGI